MAEVFESAAPHGAASFASSGGGAVVRRLDIKRRKRHFIARERRYAAYRVEIEAAIDRVKHTRSDEWFRAMMHQHVLRTVNTHRAKRGLRGKTGIGVQQRGEQRSGPIVVRRVGRRVPSPPQ